ncbi:glutaredoxin 2 [Ignatzschineria rhizosphaerae]|uniref:Glutaredoxin 2 n=1 Tax=Ignatzschineria rhizosphaerae TaxID=2923279 RepID=A0ABY3X6F1_9GAMM|nr:glutaredoxin 2 [Ignatzschineria rhizosphaerae]UNM96360.1 glutaredoxin 2 [Ignatzschineria rhizosphaerae]
MKLYLFEHCPFCVRAMLAAGLKLDVPITHEYILEDDVETPTKMIGKQMVPILEFEPQKYMPESLDIVHYLDDLNEEPFLTGTRNEKIEQWVNEHFGAINRFVMPLYAQMDFPEFKTESARQMYIDRHEEKFGSFAQLQENGKTEIPKLEAALEALGPELDLTLIEHEIYSLDDILLFPLLRALTASKAIKFPEKVKAYMTLLSEKGNVPLLTDRAIA